MSKKDSDKYAVVYARYSSHNQGEQSIEGQLSAAKAYADAKGYMIVHEYIDRAMTGRNDNRDAFQQMLSDCAKGQFSVIIVWKVDRFGRNRQEITFNKYRAKKHGVRVEYVAENLPDSPEGVILESVLEGMAEYYSLQLSQNVKRGHLESAKKRKVHGGKMLPGYRVGPNREYEIDPDTAPIIKMIFDMYASGKYTMSGIVQELNNQGLQTPQGNPYKLHNIRTILANERYTGVFIYKDIIRAEGDMPAIIDKATFAKVQEMLKRNRHAPTSTRTDYLLTGKLFCGHCGADMIGCSSYGWSNVKYTYYVCPTRKKKKTCSKENVRKDWIENLVLSEIRKILEDEELFNFIVDQTWTYYVDQNSNQEQVQALQKQLSNAQNGVNNLVKTIEAGIFNDTVKERIEALTARQTAIKKALAELQTQSGLKLTKDHIQFFLEQFRDSDYTDPACQHRLINTFVNSIFLFDDHFTLTFNFGGDKNTVTLQNIKDAEAGKEYVHCADCLNEVKTDERKIMWFCGVFAIDVKVPGD